MCILFSYISKRVKPNEFKLIILNNRDEFFFRPSKPASQHENGAIYGEDLTPGKEGGTWMGLNRLGKITVLLNLDRNSYENDENKEGRGFLVPNFLNSPASFAKYIEPIKASTDKYNPFNLLAYEKSDDRLWKVHVFDNISAELKNVDSEFVSISNHMLKSPYKKTIVGEKLFQEVVNEFNDTSKKQELMNRLFEVAKYDANLKIDDSMSSEDASEMMRSQVFIKVPGYGTRTHTIILIDDKNRITYREKTMKSPIEEGSETEWIDNTFEFDIAEN